MCRFVLLLAFFVISTSAAWAVDSEAQFYHRAFAAIASNNAQEAETFAAHGADPVLNKVVRGYAMGIPGNDYSFEQLDGFLASNPGWLGLRGVQMIAEQKIPPNASAAQVMGWFANRDPLTLVGLYRYVDALDQSGHADLAQNVVRTHWINFEFSGDEQTAFYVRYAALLDGPTMWARTDRLLWKNDDVAVQRMVPYLSPVDKAVVDARIALAGMDSNAEQLAARVPREAQADPGLLYQRVRWNIKNNRDDESDDLLLHPPAELGNQELWWDQRQIMVRRAMERHDYAMAYELALRHGQTETKTKVQAEFLCGWLTLRFLDRPQDAHDYFQALYDDAQTPITRARGAYWLGRTYEITGDKNAAEQAYEDAAVFNTTFYGQLAETRLYAEPTISAKSDPVLPDTARKAFLARDILRAIVRLNDIGETERARSFFHAAVESATERAEFVILTEIATQMGRPDLAIQAVKAANQKNMLVETGGFPLITMHVPTPPESAFTHALIRQESLFSPGAESGVGARGLMQLMPKTAKDVAKKLGIRYLESRLTEPDYSLELGTTFVQEQIDHFNGSYILALAGYNAGPGRVHEWLGKFGDPRSPDVDPIDWIEEIPIQETRNYVQRIIENLQIYRAKLAGGKGALIDYQRLKALSSSSLDENILIRSADLIQETPMKTEWLYLFAGATALSSLGFIVVTVLWLCRLRDTVSAALTEAAGQQIRTTQRLNESIAQIQKQQDGYNQQIQVLAQAGIRLQQELSNVTSRLDTNQAESHRGGQTLH